MNERITRRDAFRMLGRTGAFAALGGLAAWLVARPGSASVCTRCPSLDVCRLVEGERTRAELRISEKPDGKAASARGLCGENPAEAPGSRWIRREES